MVIPYRDKILMLLLYLAYTNAYGGTHPEYTAKFYLTRTGDIIRHNGHEGIAQTAYRPRSPDLQSISTQFGEGIRFIRAPSMGDADFDDFVHKSTTLFDDVIQRIPSVRNKLIEMSNHPSRLDMSKFNVGDRTVVAIIPPVKEYIPSSRVIPPAFVLPQPLKAKYSSQDGEYGYRNGLELDAASGKQRPVSVTLSDEFLNGYLYAKENAFPEQLGGTIDNALATLSDGKIARRLGGLEKAKSIIDDYYVTLNAITHEFGHAAAYYDGRTVGYHEFLKRKGVILDQALFNHLQLLDEIENIWFGHLAGRSLTERISTNSLVNSGLKGPSITSQFGMPVSNNYGGHRYRGVLTAIKNSGNSSGNKYLNITYGLNYPLVHQELLREAATIWETSLHLQLSIKGLSEPYIAGYINLITGKFGAVTTCSIL